MNNICISQVQATRRIKSTIIIVGISVILIMRLSNKIISIKNNVASNMFEMIDII